MNSVFTIVAKNYLSFALTLGDSLKLVEKDLDFYIFIADDIERVPSEYANKHNIIIADETIVPNHLELRFKYNVIEYSTAIKPFVFSYLFNNYNYQKIIYSDPDIYFYQSPSKIYNLLDNNFCVLTPHIIDVATAHKSEATDVGLLFAGIFNLGFIALRKSDNSAIFLNWWQERLKNYCYGDRLENLHTDQKWIDFVPSLFREGVHISDNKGFNIAYWNIHERELIEVENLLKLIAANNEAVTFLHFSGNNPLNILVNKQCKNLNIHNYPVWKKYIVEYGKMVMNNGFEILIQLPYTYNTFENGETISALHRRMYRKLKELNKTNIYDNPFGTGKNSFYELLNQNNLLVGKEKAVIDFKDEGETAVSSKFKNVFRTLRLLKKILGIKKYSTLIRAFQKLFTNENQVLLIKEMENDFLKHYIQKISN